MDGVFVFPITAASGSARAPVLCELQLNYGFNDIYGNDCYIETEKRSTYSALNTDLSAHRLKKLSQKKPGNPLKSGE